MLLNIIFGIIFKQVNMPMWRNWQTHMTQNHAGNHVGSSPTIGTNETKCIKLIGTVGELWPVTIEKLAKTYTLIDGTPITPDIPEGEFEIATIVDQTAETIFAEQVKDQVQVATSWGEIYIKNDILNYIIIKIVLRRC